MTVRIIETPTTVTVTSDDGPAATVVLEETVVTIAAPGPRGAKGDTGAQGPPGGSAYVHTQSSPSASWIINHNLGREVHVTLYDTVTPPLRMVFSDVEHGSLNQTTVTFPAPVAGLAVLS